MNWTSFISWLALLYLLYYGINIFIDHRGGRTETGQQAQDDLTYFEADNPQLVALPTAQSNPSLPSGAYRMEPRSGAPAVNAVSFPSAVSVDQAFELARKELIEKTRSLSY